MKGSFHERLDQSEHVPLPSDRSTGFVFCFVALLIALLGRNHPVVLYSGLVTAAAFAILSFAVPTVLHPLNVAWMRFAMLLSKVMNPIVMLILFAIAIVPAGVIMQLFRDPLAKKRKTGSASYWMPVDAAERARSSNMTQQF